MQARITLPSTRAAPSVARAWAAEVGHGLQNDLLEDLRLVVTELVTNAVKYGPDEPIEVCLHVRPPDLARGVVIDRGEHGHDVRARPGAPGTQGGHGLRIVDALARRWGVDDGSTQVWFVLGADDRLPQAFAARHGRGTAPGGV